MIQSEKPVDGKILIVDDEAPLLKMMSLYLGRLGFTVVSANTTEKAWAEMEAAPADFAIAVLDATMDGMTMRELARRILAASPTVRVLAASGYPVDMSEEKAQAPGRVDFLHKPFTPEMLGSAVRRMLAPQEENI